MISPPGQIRWGYHLNMGKFSLLECYVSNIFTIEKIGTSDGGYVGVYGVAGLRDACGTGYAHHNTASCGHQFSDICGTCKTLEGVPVKYEEKPPLGIKPRYIHDGERVREILNAMDRYSKASKHIPGEWIDELGDLINELIGGKDA